MNLRSSPLVLPLAAALLLGGLVPAARGQVVINEMVYDIAGEAPDVREYVELYNAGGSAVDISNWSVGFIDLTSGNAFADVIPGGTMLAAGDYYVIGSTGVPNLDQDIQMGQGIELYPDGNAIIELRDNSANLVDALGYEFNKGFASATPAQLAELGPHAWWGNTQSYNIFPAQLSLARYQDGLDRDNNGRDFGNIVSTPGTSNNLPSVAMHNVPDVDGLAVGADAPNYSASFVLPAVIDPAVVDTNNPNAIAPSPQGGLAITAWDPAGGGNAVYSNELVTGFDLYAYLDPTPYGIATGGVIEYESTTYGIGTTGTLHNTPDPTGKIFGDVITANANTGVGWVFQKEEIAGLYSLLLVDFNDGGPSNPASADWTVIEEIDFTGQSPAWHRLGIDYNPATGDVAARLDDQTFNFNASTELVGTFYVGYREGVTAAGAGGVNTGLLRPPTFDLIGTAPADDADFNNDGVVDGADLLIWQRSFGASGAGNDMGDANGDSSVDGLDLDVWKSQFGSAPAAAAVAAVPEPSTTSMALALLAGSVAWRRRRRR